MRNLISLSIALLLAPCARAGLVAGTANLVLGQPNMNESAANFVDNIGMAGGGGVLVDSAHQRIFMSDQANNRVMVWNELNVTNGQPADVVLGQPDLYSNFSNGVFSGSNGAGIGPATLAGPIGIAVDSSGNLWVSDSQNSRVVRYSPPFTTGMSANLVLGQTDLSSFRIFGPPPNLATALLNPAGLAFDPSGNLWVSDHGASRVLGFSPPFTNNQAAYIVLGQLDFGTDAYSPQPNQGVGGGSPITGCVSTSTLSGPLGITADSSSNIWVADAGNNRVVEYAVPLSSGMNASVVLGQPDFVSASANQTANDVACSSGTTGGTGPGGPGGPGTGPNPGMPPPTGGPTPISIWVPVRPLSTARTVASAAKPTAQRGRVRPLPSIPTCGGPFPPCPTSNPEGAYTLDNPADLKFDASGNLWVSDVENQRVLGYASGSLVTDSSATMVIGQTGFTTNAAPLSPNSSSLDVPIGLSFDSNGNLWLSDGANARVLEYPSASLSTLGPSATLVLGQRDFSHGTLNYLDGKGVSNPNFLAFLPGGGVAAADSGNDRVLWWNSIASMVNGQPASGVIGQQDLYSNPISMGTPTPSSTTLGGIGGLAVDSSGNLWVTDTYFSRVLRFPAPLSTGEGANLVLGEPDFVTNNMPSASSNTFSEPEGLAFDASGHLWVAEFGNNRVVRFSPPFTTFMNADLVLGQPNLVSGQKNQNSLSLAGNMLADPTALAFDAFGNVWVVDAGNERILGYQSPLSNGMSATTVLGQPNLTTGMFEGLGPNSISFNATTIAIDTTTGNLWLADSGFERVVRFPAPLTTGENADFVLGQPNLTTSNIGAPSSSSLNFPEGVGIDGLGNLWVADTQDNRLLDFGSVAAANGLVSATAPTTVSYVLPQLGTLLANIPSGAFNQLCQVFFSTPPTLPSLIQPGLVPSQVSFDISNNLGIQPSKPITVTFTYSPSAIAGLDPSKLVVAYYNPATGQWVNQPTVDSPATHSVTVTLLHFSLYALFQQLSSPDLSGVYVYPDPYRPGTGGAYNGSTTLGQGIVFAGLTTDARIRVFTLSGDLVADFSTNLGTGKALWNVQNNKGETVASGVYIYLVTNPNDSSQKAKGRLAIIK